MSEATKLIGSNWTKEEIPKDWFEWEIVPTYKKNDRSL